MTSQPQPGPDFAPPSPAGGQPAPSYPPPAPSYPTAAPQAPGYPVPQAQQFPAAGYPAPQQFGPAGNSFPAPGQYAPPGQPYSPAPAAPQGPENVGRGVVFALASIPVGVGLTMVAAAFGFIASITSWLAAIAALKLYTTGAGAAPRKGAAPLVGVVLVGVVLSFLGMVGTGLWVSFRGRGDRLQFVLTHLFDPRVLSDYAVDGLLFLVFAGLGVFGILRVLAGNKKGQVPS